MSLSRYYDTCDGCGFGLSFCLCKALPSALLPGVAKPPSAEESAAMAKFQQQVDDAMDKMYKSYQCVGMDWGMNDALIAEPSLPPVPTVPKCSGCDQERDLGATGKCWDCYVVQEKVMTVSQLAYDQAEAAKVEQIKRTTMLAGSIDPLWQRNPNVGVWRLR